MDELERLEQYRLGYNHAIEMQGQGGNGAGRHMMAQRFGRWFMRSDWSDYRPAWAEWLNLSFKEKCAS